jgi:hypothetical protein
VIVKTLEAMPKDATHWSTRSLAEVVGISPASVQRIWGAFDLQPWRSESFKLSTDPLFIDMGSSAMQADSGASKSMPLGLTARLINRRLLGQLRDALMCGTRNAL